MLDAESLATFLFERGLLTPAAVVGGEVVIRQASSRNHNFQVVSRLGPSYFVKQGIDAETVATIEREARVYRFAGTPQVSPDLRRHIPRMIDFDTDKCILVIELVQDAVNLGQYLAKRRKFSNSIGSQLGHTLSALHSLPEPGEFRVHESDVPWVFAFPDVTLESLRELSSASIELAKVVQRFCGFRDLLWAQKDEWNRNALIHYDLKAGNCLVSPGPTGKRFSRVSVIDWELARVGDAGWDVGSVFADYLSTWIFSIPVSADVPVETLPELAQYPLADIQPAMRSFWSAYLQASGLDESTSQDLLLRSIKYAAARLTQTAFEQAQSSSELTGTSVLILQVAWNILKRPVEAIVWLLGLQLDEIWSPA